MYRCLELAKLAAGYVAPNPMVGAVLLYNGQIIGEGYHQEYGGPHAEPNCLESVKEENIQFISSSTLYVSLEPCVHYGKTPPCTDLIIRHKIPKVIIGCRDPFKEVNGKGIEKLRTAGTEVEPGVLEKECKELNKRFFCFHTQHRPYIILKWAETADGKMAAPSNSPNGGESHTQTRIGEENIYYSNSRINGVSGADSSPMEGSRMGARLFISNEYSNRLVHKWRSEEAAILIGTNTALMDDPQLTTRLWNGRSPMRLVVDMDLKLPSSLKIFNGEAPTIVFNKIKHDLNKEAPTPHLPIAIGMERAGVRFYQVTEDVNLVHQIINALYLLKIQSLIVEGGARLLQSFIDEDLWDEARIVRSSELRVQNGLPAPQLSNALKSEEQIILSDIVEVFKPLRDRL